MKLKEILDLIHEEIIKVEVYRDFKLLESKECNISEALDFGELTVTGIYYDDNEYILAIELESGV